MNSIGRFILWIFLAPGVWVSDRLGVTANQNRDRCGCSSIRCSGSWWQLLGWRSGPPDCRSTSECKYGVLLNLWDGRGSSFIRPRRDPPARLSVFGGCAWTVWNATACSLP